MRRLAIAVATVCAASLGALQAAAQSEVDLARQIDRWFRHWKAGKVRLEEAIESPTLADRLYGEGVVPSRSARPIRHREALELMVNRVRERQGAETTRALLRLASVGLDGDPVDPARSPLAVRTAALSILETLDEATAVDTLVAATEPGERDLGVRVAALLALGGVPHPVVRVFVERRLDDEERLVRLAAAESIGARGHAASVDDLVERIAVETDGIVLQAAVGAAHRILRQTGTEVDPGTALRLTLTSIDAIGRADWRADLAIVDLLMDARSARAIPALIDVLARFDGRSGKGDASALLRERAHEVLESLTGTRIRAEDVGTWREFWERERDGFAVAPRVERRTDADATTTGFFGIPVRGSRIVFVIDVSGSMQTEITANVEGTTDAATATRLDWAKRELWNAVRELPSTARFSVVVFASNVHRWGRSFPPATRSTRSDLRQMLSTLAAEGATNLWGALDAAIGVSDAAWGRVEDEGADEVFLLTDGFPSAGDVTSPDAIVEAVRDANRYRRVRIHSVSLAGDAGFLRRLATENGGTFVQR